MDILHGFFCQLFSLEIVNLLDVCGSPHFIEMIGVGQTLDPRNQMEIRMKKTVILLLIIICGALTASERGMTTSEFNCEGPVLFPAPLTEAPVDPHFEALSRTEWVNLYNWDFDVILPSRSQFGLRFRNYEPNFFLYSSVCDFPTIGTTAINKAPAWMRAELQNTLWHLSNDKLVDYCNLILSVSDPIIDEICFAIAYSSLEYLESDFASPQLFLENASCIYSIDQDLDYVSVVDHGSSLTDPNYYSSTQYFRKNAEGVTETVEVPREIYYWYIVHPKLSDEIPAYIDPSIVENNSNHNNNIADPPTGVFWRSWLYTVAEGDYPTLADTLQQCTTLFNRNNEGGDAIRTIQWWINQTMGFTSNNERPHQPVRIYRKHIGRCGEYQDYTNAVARLALIPCTNITSVSTDHVWNEFWESEWVQWEPVNGYINTPLVYENGWGKVFGSVFETRSDGYFTPVTERYSEGLATINIRVVDQNQVPVDGARVILAIFETSPRLDTVGFTGNDGWVSFSVGENRDYRARCETPWGLYPSIPGTYAALTSASVDGETYNYLFTIEAVKPAPVYTQIEAPLDPLDDYRMSVVFNSPAYYLNGQVTWDDISSLGTPSRFYKYVPLPASVSALTVNSDDLLFLQLDMFASTWDDTAPVNSGQIDFSIPIGMDWYTILDNSHSSGNAVRVQGNLITDTYGLADNDDNMSPPQNSIRAWPNPFSEFLRIIVSAPRPNKLYVYNLRGQLVRVLTHLDFHDGVGIYSWDGKDDNANACANGVYYIMTGAGEQSETRKVLLLK